MPTEKTEYQDKLTPKERATFERLAKTGFAQYTRMDCCALMDIINRLAPSQERAGRAPIAGSIANDLWKGPANHAG